MTTVILRQAIFLNFCNFHRFRVQPTYGQAIKKRNPCRSSAFSFRKLPIRQVNNFFLSDLIEIIFSCLFGRNQQIIYTLARAKFQPSTLIHRFRGVVFCSDQHVKQLKPLSKYFIPSGLGVKYDALIIGIHLS